MADNGFLFDAFRAMGMNITSDAEYEVPKPGDMTIKGDTFVSYHPNIPEGNMTKVIVPDGIKVIGKEAFMGPDQSHNHYLECCRLPEGVTTIKKEAFALCASMNEIELPSTLKKIESGVFMYSGLRKINLPEGLESIGDGAFQNCRSIRELRIPSTVTKIGNYCFSQMGVPLMARDQPGAKIIAPSYLKDIYDKDYLNDLFDNHEVEWYKASKPKGESLSISADDIGYCCTFTANGNQKCNVSLDIGNNVNLLILICQLGRVLSLLDDIGINRDLIANTILENYDEGAYSDICKSENPDSALVVTVFAKSSDNSCYIAVDDSKAGGGEVFTVIYACAEMLKALKIPDDIIKYLISLYYSSEDYDDFASNISDLVEKDLSDDYKVKSSVSDVKNYPKTFNIKGNKLVKYTGKGYSVDVPDCVEIIGAGAFEGNRDYHDIRIRDRQPKEDEYNAALMLGAAHKNEIIELLRSKEFSGIVNNSGCTAVHTFNVDRVLIMRYDNKRSQAAVNGNSQ